MAMGIPTSETKLGPASTAFGISAAVTVIFNTILACVKDAYKPLAGFMNSVAGHNWTTQGIADVLLFGIVGISLMKANSVRRIGGNRLVTVVVVATVVAGLGLLSWYALF